MSKNTSQQNKTFQIILNIFSCIFCFLGLISVIALLIIYFKILPLSVSKNLVLFYLGATGILTFIMFCSNIIEVSNLIKHEHIKNFIRFKDYTEPSYIYFCFVIIPLITMIIITSLMQVTQTTILPDKFLKIVYWSVAAANFIWILYHLIYANTSKKRKRLNLVLKFAVCIVSGMGFIMDFIGRIDFTKQVIFIAWIVLIAAYISDRMTIKEEEKD